MSLSPQNDTASVDGCPLSYASPVQPVNLRPLQWPYKCSEKWFVVVLVVIIKYFHSLPSSSAYGSRLVFQINGFCSANQSAAQTWH